MLRSCRLIALLTASLLLILAPSPATAQSGADTTFVSLLRGTELGVGTLLQVDADANRDEAPDSFTLRTARLRLSGRAPGLRFLLQTDFNRTPSVLDVRLRVPVSPTVSIAAGLYKSPFSAEFLASRSNLILLERARVVNALAPQRQTGIAGRADLLDERLRVEGGVFNGNGGRLRLDDNDAFLYVGRLSGTLPLRRGQLEAGVNAAISNDEDTALGPVAASFTGQRVVAGADARLRYGSWTVAGEWITASLDANEGPTYRPWGYHATVGYAVAARHQLVLRFDDFSDGRTATEDDDELLLGYNLFWTTALKLQVNYATPLDALDEGAVGARLQLALD